MISICKKENIRMDDNEEIVLVELRGLSTDTKPTEIDDEKIDNGSVYKNLSEQGFTSANYPATRIQALPHYQDFVSAGWSIGY